MNATHFSICVHIHCCGNGHLGFRPDGDSLFLQTPKKSKQKNACSYVRPARWGSGFLRCGIDPGGIAYGLLRCTSSRCVWLRQTVAALPPRINPSTQPSDVARGSRSRAAAELTLILRVVRLRRVLHGTAAGCDLLISLFVGAELAREGGLPADQCLTDRMQSLCELTCQRWRPTGRPVSY